MEGIIFRTVMLCGVAEESTVLEKYTASIFRAKKYAQQSTSKLCVTREGLKIED
jgi:hypothetical protein